MYRSAVDTRPCADQLFGRVSSAQPCVTSNWLTSQCRRSLSRRSGMNTSKLATPIITSTVGDYRDGRVSQLISPDAVVEIYLVPSNDDEPLPGERGAHCIRVSLRRLDADNFRWKNP